MAQQKPTIIECLISKPFETPKAETAKRKNFSITSKSDNDLSARRDACTKTPKRK